jgi:hypothetical protein
MTGHGFILENHAPANTISAQYLSATGDSPGVR